MLPLLRSAPAEPDLTEELVPLEVIATCATTAKPDPRPDPGPDELEWRTCTEKDCGVSFRLDHKPGRPPKKCPAHRKRAA